MVTPWRTTFWGMVKTLVTLIVAVTARMLAVYLKRPAHELN